MAKVVLKNIKKVYTDNRSKRKMSNLEQTEEGVVAVQDFNLEIADKEFVVLVGPSGCGKSTTLRMIAGLEEITSGELYIGDKLMNDVEPRDRNIAMVFQNYALYPHMSVRENMAYPLKLHKYSKQDIKKKVEEAAEILDIKELLDRKPKALSGGQRQRVAIGRAIVRDPQVLLMDEPLSNLDAKLRNQMRSEIIELRKKIDTTFVYVTHDQIEAMTLGDRIVVMKDGYIQQIGTPQEVFEHPRNLFVAGFIGTPPMNFFYAKLIRENNKYRIDLNGYVTDLPDRTNNVLNEKNIESQDITLGVRPNHLTPADEGIDAKINICEMMGTEIHAHLDVNGNETIIIVPSNKGYNLKPSEHIKISFDCDDIHMFDKTSGNNLI